MSLPTKNHRFEPSSAGDTCHLVGQPQRAPAVSPSRHDRRGEHHNGKRRDNTHYDADRGNNTMAQTAAPSPSSPNPITDPRTNTKPRGVPPQNRRGTHHLPLLAVLDGLSQQRVLRHVHLPHHPTRHSTSGPEPCQPLTRHTARHRMKPPRTPCHLNLNTRFLPSLPPPPPRRLAPADESTRCPMDFSRTVQPTTWTVN
jgi:hypothetical protein